MIVAKKYLHKFLENLIEMIDEYNELANEYIMYQQKDPKDISPNEIIVYRQIRNRMSILYSDILRRKQLLASTIHDINSIKGEYYLLNDNDIVGPENARQLKDALEKIIVFNKRLSSIMPLIQQTDEIFDQANEIKKSEIGAEKSSILERYNTDIVEYIKEPSEPDGVCMHVVDTTESSESVMVVSDKIRELMQVYFACEDYYNPNPKYFIYFTSPNSLEEKQAVKQYNQLVKEILSSDDIKYDRKIKITIPVYLIEYCSDPKEFGHGVPEVDNLDIETTARELATAGIHYEDFEYEYLEPITHEESRQVTPDAIAKATSGLPTRALHFAQRLFLKVKEELKVR